MKKIVTGLLISSCMLFASDKAVELKSDLFDLNKIKSEEMKSFLLGVEYSHSLVGKVLKDYYEAKTCDKEFYNKVTVDEIREFIVTAPFGVLLALSYFDSEKDTKDKKYTELINTYKFLNCGDGLLPNFDKYLKEKQWN